MNILCLLPSVEIKDGSLIFVLKMDEAEIVYGEKLECICITLMNRALNPEIVPGSNAYFSVQLERDIWPVACFRVPKDTHAVLSWVFRQTNFPSLIATQDAGQPLIVDGVGSFQVEWHLSCDLKTIKCLYGLKGNAKSSCMYCNQKKSKNVITTKAQAVVTAKKRTPGWAGGLFAKDIGADPLSGVASATRWKPIFPIPLQCVHFCTLHALNRICEKMLHMHFQYVWAIREKTVQSAAILDTEKVLSNTGISFASS